MSILKVSRGDGETLIAPGNVPMSNAKNEHSQTAKLALFLFALKDVDQLDMKDATSLLRTIRRGGSRWKVRVDQRTQTARAKVSG